MGVVYMTESKPNYKEVRAELENTGQTLYLPETTTTNVESIYGQTTKSSGKDFVIGALVGGVIGAAAALFLAPKAGKDLRNDVIVQASSLKEKSSDLTSQAKEKAGVLKDKGTVLASQAKEKSVQIGKRVQEQAGPVVDKVKSLKGGVQQPLDDGTAFAEGEDPFDIMQTVENTIAEIEAESEAIPEPDPDISIDNGNTKR